MSQPNSCEQRSTTPNDGATGKDALLDLPLLIRVEEAAALLGVGRTTTYALIAAGELETVAIGTSRRVPRDAVTAYVERLRAARSTAA